MNIFKKIFGSKSKVDKTPINEKSTYIAKTISKSDLEKLKTGDVITLGDKPKTTYEAKWIKAIDNPYKRDIFDCREYAINMLSSSQNSQVAKKFLELRKSDGKEYIGKFPTNGAKCDVELNFLTKGKQIPDGVVFKAQTMEQKWDIYKYSSFFFFVRSWTGELVYFTNYKPTDNGFIVDLIVLDDNKIDPEDQYFEFKVVEFLIHSHVLNLNLPHPIPKKLENSADKILAYSYSMFGNRGYYASYE